jgi:hypothetical protein
MDLQKLIQTASETFVIVVVTAMARRIVAKCTNKCNNTTLTHRKRKQGGKLKK